MKFVADVMLGKLARFLRMMGQDVLYFEKAEDNFLIYVAKESNRVLLTRDTRLWKDAVSAKAKSLLLRSNYVKEQVKEVFEATKIKPVRARNCPSCNGALKKKAKYEIEGLVPEFVWNRNSDFWMCERCGKIYWSGSHIRNFVKFLGFNPWDDHERRPE